MNNVTIYHNPDCGTSRNTLAMIRNAGIEPQVVEYLKTPPTRDELKALIARMGVPVREVLRQKGTPYEGLGLGEGLAVGLAVGVGRGAGRPWAGDAARARQRAIGTARVRCRRIRGLSRRKMKAGLCYLIAITAVKRQGPIGADKSLSSH